jgi:poly(3-hydroxybutyrate) depolymerase
VVVVPERSALLPDDANFLRQLVTEVRRTVDVDMNKVYVSGISDGANVALEAGCEGAGFFAGVSPNSGAGNCGRVARPIPVIAFASRQDLNYAANLNAVQAAARANGCRGDAKPWRTFDANTRDAVCRSANGDARARLVPCTEVRERIQPTQCRHWDGCQNGTQVVICDVAAANPHGLINISGDAHLVYENASFLNTPSVAWRFFKQF